MTSKVFIAAALIAMGGISSFWKPAIAAPHTERGDTIFILNLFGVNADYQDYNADAEIIVGSYQVSSYQVNSTRSSSTSSISTSSISTSSISAVNRYCVS